MSSVFDFFCENVTAVDDSRDVGYVHAFCLMSLTNHVFLQVDMFDAFRRERVAPLHASLIVVVDRSGKLGISHVQICRTFLDRDEVGDTSVRRLDLSLARAESCLILPTGLPRYGASTSANKVARDGPKLK